MKQGLTEAWLEFVRSFYLQIGVLAAIITALICLGTRWRWRSILVIVCLAGAAVPLIIGSVIWVLNHVPRKRKRSEP